MEDAMKTVLKTHNQTRTDLNHEVSQFIFTIVSAAALLIGLWGATCLISGLVSDGFFSMVRGYFSAITGV